MPAEFIQVSQEPAFLMERCEAQGEDGDREDLQHRDMRHLTRGGSLSTRGTQLTLYRLCCAGTDN